jgi:SAM-dependent methyltransferase
VTRAEDIKTCCAAAYGSDLVALLLGDSYHPGGLTLTRRLVGKLALTSGQRVLDVAAGRGSTALLLATEFGVAVEGVDLAAENVALAERAAAAACVGERVHFRLGDAERLPFDDDSFDAVICECAFCTFPDKAAAAKELARVVRPGGRLGITDVTVDPDRLPAGLRSLRAWVACIADARPLEGYAEILREAGLRTVDTERHDQALGRMIDQIEARLAVVKLTARDRAEALGLDFDQVPAVLEAARTAMAEGVLGYGLLMAEPVR